MRERKKITALSTLAFRRSLALCIRNRKPANNLVLRNTRSAPTAKGFTSATLDSIFIQIGGFAE